ncbi:MAG: hypothetical protein ACJ0K4_10280 [Verrucomicrobiales bacterium]
MALQQSEKRLMALLLIAVIGVINVIGYTVIEDKKKAMQDLQIAHQQKLDNYKFLELTKVQWEQKRDFLGTNAQPMFVSEEAANDEVESHLINCAGTADISQTSLVIKPMGMVEMPHYNQVALNVAVSGSSMSIIKLISLLQASNHTTQYGYYVIPNIKFEADRKDPSILKCAFVLARWYKNQNFLTNIKGSTGLDLANSHKNIKLLVSK